jgi:hypothetical protein
MDTPEISPVLPDAQTFLQGKQGIKPHQYTPERLRAFIDGFEDVPLTTKAAHTLVEAQKIMEKPEWVTAHDAAHNAIHNALKMLADSPTQELAKEASAIESIYKSQALNPGTLKMVKHPELVKSLEPLAKYLEEFQGFLRSWTTLQPGRMKPRHDDAVSPAKHRENLEILKLSQPKAAAEAPILNCGDIHCTVDHTAGAAKSAFSKATNVAENAGKAVRRNPALWVAAACTVSLGAYLISQYGKHDRKRPAESHAWQTRTSEGQTLQEGRGV